MKRLLFLVPVLVHWVATAAILPPEKLLPADTLFFVTAPDVNKLGASFAASPQSQLWNDPAMKPFREHFLAKFNSSLVGPLEKELGIKFSDYKDLAQGQFTLALTQNGWQGKSNQEPAVVLLLDAKDQKDKLKANLDTLKKKWVDSGKKVKVDKFQNVEFTTVTIADKDAEETLKKAFADFGGGEDDEPELDEKGKPVVSTNTTDFIIAQTDSLLLFGDTAKVLEKIVIKQTGGAVPTIDEDPVFQANHAAILRDSHVYAWVNLKSAIQLTKDLIKENQKKPNPMAPPTDKIFSALGLDGLKSIAIASTLQPEGSTMKIFLGAPEASRVGLVRLLIPEAKETAPPAFVPADSAKYSRIRLDLQKTFNGFETIMTDLFPPYAGTMKLLFENAGKDADPNYDLRKELIGNLGDDMISYQKPPRGESLKDLSSPPSLFLLSSPAPEKLAKAIKVVVSSFGADPDSIKERDFMGRKVYDVSLPSSEFTPEGKEVPSPGVHFSTGNGYLAIGADVSLLEEFLRSSDGKTKPLAELPGLKEAVERAGGYGTGFFSFENQAVAARSAFNLLKKNGGSLSTLLGDTPMAGQLSPKDEKTFKEWADFSLLPSYDAVAKYFFLMTSVGKSDAQGYTIQVFTPVPPALKK